ncbi:MAG: hypothetical protein WCO26_14570, partial [Deltaproteobacteria bacterium]
MNFPSSYPAWIWLYFGTLGSISAVFFSLIAWSWLKSRSFAKGQLRSAITWNMIGYMFLFIGAYFACGIGGTPGGNLLSHDVTIHEIQTGTRLAVLSMF